MSDDTTEARIRRILANVLEVDPEKIGDEFGPADSELWDSLNALRMVTELETEFGVRLRMEDIPKMVDFAAIRRTVEKYRAEAGAN